MTWLPALNLSNQMSVFTQLGATWLLQEGHERWSGKTGNKNVQLRLALQHHWKTNGRRRCTFYHSRIKPFLKQITFLHVAKGCCKKIEQFLFKSFCNLRQPDLCLIRGRLNAERRFSTRSAVMLQNKLHIVSCAAFFSVAFRHLLQTSSPLAGKIRCMYRICYKR